MANSRGERGHPCLTPKDGCTKAVLSPSNNVYSSAWYKSFKMDGLLRWSGIWQLRKWPQSLCLQNQQIALQISLSNSTFPDKAVKQDVFLVLDKTHHICHSAFCGFANIHPVSTLRVWARKRKRAILRSTCLLCSSCRYLGSK